jgi:integrase
VTSHGIRHQARRGLVFRYKDARGKWVGKATKARNKTEARELAEAFERQAERQVAGLAPLPTDDTLADLLQWWIDHRKTRTESSAKKDAFTIGKHLLGSELAKIPLVNLRTPHIAAWLEAKTKEISPQTVNHLRRYIVSSFKLAALKGRYVGPNPALGIPRQTVHVDPTKQEYLRRHEVERVIGALPAQYRGLFAVAVLQGLRKGELFGLRRSDVDFQAGQIRVARSHGNDTTKGGHADYIPILSDAEPFLRAALDSHKGELLFPNPDGKMYREDTKLANVLRRALKRAGIVEHYEHVCRRKGCGHAERHADDQLRVCPKCDFKLWPKAIVRGIRFHDLRATTASLLIANRVPLAVAQRIMRHSSPAVTMRYYARFDTEFLKNEMEKISFGGALSKLATKTASHVPPMCTVDDFSANQKSEKRSKINTVRP